MQIKKDQVKGVNPMEVGITHKTGERIITTTISTRMVMTIMVIDWLKPFRRSKQLITCC